MIENKQDETTLLALINASGIILWIIVPILVLILKKDGSEYFNKKNKEFLNFEITMTIAMIAIQFLVVGMMKVLPFLAFVPMLIWIINIVICLQAAVALNSKQDYKYPFSLNLIQ